MGASLFAIIGSHSRGAFVATIPMLFLLVVMSRRRALLFLLAACFLVGAAFFVPDKWIDRMRTIETYEEDHGSAMARIRVWTFAIKLALDRPLTGGGFYPYADTALYFSYVPDAITPRNFHSIYFEVLGELGFVGLGIYLALLLSCALAARRIIARSRGDPELGWANRPRAHDSGGARRLLLCRTVPESGLLRPLPAPDRHSLCHRYHRAQEDRRDGHRAGTRARWALRAYGRPR